MVAGNPHWLKVSISIGEFPRTSFLGEAYFSDIKLAMAGD